MAVFNTTITIPSAIQEAIFFQNIDSSSDEIKVTCNAQSGESTFIILSYSGCTVSPTTSPQNGGVVITLSNFSATYVFNITAVGTCYGKSKASLRGGSGNYLQTTGAISLDDLRDHFGTDSTGDVSLLNYFRNYQIVNNLGDNLVPSFKVGELGDWAYAENAISGAVSSTSPNGGDLSITGSGGFTDGYPLGIQNWGTIWIRSAGTPSENSTGFVELGSDSGLIYQVFAVSGAGDPAGDGTYRYDIYYRTYEDTLAINQGIPVYDATTSIGPISLDDFYGADSEGF